MFLIVDQHQLAKTGAVRGSMLRDRAGQFVERHKWPLKLDWAGREIDQYDDGFATYCIVAQGDRHLASVRLRPGRAGSMTEHAFPELGSGATGLDLQGGTEITRFCSAPGLSADQRLTAVSDLLLGLCRHCQRSGIASIFGVVFPAVNRVIRQAGWNGEVLSEARQGGATLLLCSWTPSDLVAWSIQEKREFREECRSRHRERALVA